MRAETNIHQPRDHRIPCTWCRQPTPAVHAVCDQCLIKGRPGGSCARCADLGPVRESELVWLPGEAESFADSPFRAQPVEYLALEQPDPIPGWVPAIAACVIGLGIWVLIIVGFVRLVSGQ